jgi:hypothetical protein
MVELNSDMVFFRSRFVGVLSSLGKVLAGEGDDRKGERLCGKIYQILAKLPEGNYQIYACRAREDHLMLDCPKVRSKHNKAPIKQLNAV